jgi:Domain of unknown function (DUF4157)
MRLHENDLDTGPAVRPARDRQPDDRVADGPSRLDAARGYPLGAADVLRLQRLAGNSGVSALLADREEDEAPSPVKEVVGSGGDALDDATRQDMEARLGHDFGDVRVHTDARATESAQSVNAHAYTVGNDVVFQRDRYAPGTDEGRKMLAHELTHVVQQRSGAVDGTPAPGGIRVSDPGDRFEREAAGRAEQVLSDPAQDVAPPVTQAAPVQRQEAPEEEAPEEEAVQGAWVQRAEEPEEEQEDQESPAG